MSRTLIGLGASVVFAFTIALPVQWNAGNPVFDAPSAYAKGGNGGGQLEKEYGYQSAREFAPKSVEATLAKIEQQIARIEEEEAAEAVAKPVSAPISDPLAPTLSEILNQ